MRSLTLLLLGLVGVAAALWALLSVFEEAPPSRPDRLVFVPLAFDRLEGWPADRQGDALAAFRRSCDHWDERPGERALLASQSLFGTYADWLPLCTAARAIAPDRHDAARAFFERNFTPLAARNNDNAVGLFTGYYEPELKGARAKDTVHSVPLYQRPDDLITVDLGEFRSDLKGRRLAGRIEGTRLAPYPARAQIERVPPETHDPLVWVSDPIDAFFLHIQGSGRVRLDDGSVMRVGYAAQNGHPYTAIGRVLVRDGHMAIEDVTMQSIRRWLTDNPDQAADIMNSNASYVYFREIDVTDPALGPLGAQSVPLTPGRSLAVDRTHWPLGVPIWLASSWPAAPMPQAAPPSQGAAEEPLRRLMIAQDTGGAIRGPIRGDVFLGFGAAAADIAGRMKQEGRMTLLLPRALAAAHVERAGQE